MDFSEARSHDVQSIPQSGRESHFGFSLFHWLTLRVWEVVVLRLGRLVRCSKQEEMEEHEAENREIGIRSIFRKCCVARGLLPIPISMS